MSAPHVCFADVPQYSDEHDTTKLDTYDKMLQNRRQQQQQQQQQQLQQGQVDNSQHETSINIRRNGGGSSPTPRYERNMGFFQQLSRRFGFKPNDDLVKAAIDSAASIDDDANSSSTDSYSSGTAAAAVGMAANSMHGSTTASLSSSSTANSSRYNKYNKHDSSLEQISGTSSATSSTNDINELQQQHDQLQQRGRANAKENKPAAVTTATKPQRRSTSSIRRAFESFSLSSRSLSCSGASPPPPPYAATARPNEPTMPMKSALKTTSNMELNKRTAITATKTSSKSKAKPPPQRILRQPVSYTYLKGISGLPTQRVPRSSVCCQYARR